MTNECEVRFCDDIPASYNSDKLKDSVPVC